MAKFLQDTIEEMAVKSNNPNKREAVLEFATFFEKVPYTFTKPFLPMFYVH